MRMTLVIPSLRPGGAERVMSLMGNHWADRGHSLTLLTYDSGASPPFYDLDPRIRHVPLGLSGDSHSLAAAVRNNLRRVVILRSTIRRSAPDVVISFLEQTNVITLLAAKGLKIPVVVSERMDPATYRTGAAWDRARLLTYPGADRIVVQTRRAADYFPPRLRGRVCVIPNPVIRPPSGEPAAKCPLGRPAVIAIGRLHPQKGFDLLLRAFASLGERHREWTLVILGEGPSRAELELLRDQLGLEGRAHFPGVVKNPHAYLMGADLYVLSSRFEGFPNTLCEAMACGLPVISTDCRSGPGEIIRDGADGLLVPNGDVGALAAAMERLMADGDERRRLAARAPEVVERFGVGRVMGTWEELLGRVLKEAGG